MRAVCTLVLLGLLAAIAASAHAQEPTQNEFLNAIEKQLKATAETAGPAIATIVVSRSEFYPKTPGAADTPGKLGGFDPREFLKNDSSAERTLLAKSLDLADVKSVPDRGYAGGVVIDAEGYVLTPYHVIDGATKVYVFLPGGVGSYADIHAADSRSDLAVLKLLTPPPKLKAIKLADVRTEAVNGEKANVFTGKLCMLMANPYSSTFGIDQPTAAFGSITNVRRRFRKPVETSIPARYTEYGTLLEYDVKPNAGMTGGALLNLDGELIGLTNAAAVAWGSEIGPGHAMPADDKFRRIVAVLRRGEEVEYGFLGVERRQGLVIAPLRGGAAEDAGMSDGDVITKVNGIVVEEFDDLLFHIGSALAGSRVKVTVSQLGRERDVEVILGKYKNEQPSIASVRPEPVFGIRVDYSSLLTQQRRNPKDNTPLAMVRGVWVREVVANSPAAPQFKTLGDEPRRWLITEVNGARISNPAEFYKAAKGQEKLKLTLRDPAEANPRDRELTIP